jgi:CheY-like chemotaxis protein
MPNPTVLFVEDEQNDVFFMERGFEQLPTPHQFRVVLNGRDAVDYLAGHGRFQDRQRYPLPSLVLLDLSLPVLRGFEVLAWMREQPEFKKLPVVIFSASDLESDRKKALEMGANEYVVKPMDMTQVSTLLQQLLKRWLPLIPPAKPSVVPPPLPGNAQGTGRMG